VSEDRDYESEAVEQGWNADFDGPNKTDAKTFVERGEQIAGILKSKNKKLEDRLHKLEAANAQFGEYHKQTIETQKKKTAEKIETLEEELAQAITDGDGQAYNLRRKQIDSLKSEPQGPADQNAYAQMAQEWVSENKWYSDNPKLATFADGLSERVAGSGFSGQAYFSELTRQVKDAFPEEFKNPAKTAAQAVETGGKVSTTNSKAKTFDNLDDDAKAACDQFVDAGIFKSREDYVKVYEWEQ
jgi:hypothetical protein